MFQSATISHQIPHVHNTQPVLLWHFTDLCKTEEESNSTHELQHLSCILLDNVWARFTRRRSVVKASLQEEEVETKIQEMPQQTRGKDQETNTSDDLRTAAHETLLTE